MKRPLGSVSYAGRESAGHEVGRMLSNFPPPRKENGGWADPIPRTETRSRFTVRIFNRNGAGIVRLAWKGGLGWGTIKVAEATLSNALS